MLQFILIRWQKLINHRFRLENYFQEILYLNDVWINNRSGWIVESIESQYINISTYRPLSGSSYISLPEKIKSTKKRTNQREKQRSKMFFMVSC